MRKRLLTSAFIVLVALTMSAQWTDDASSGAVPAYNAAPPRKGQKLPPILPKEQLLGLYVLNCADEEEAIGIARDLRRANPTAVYEIRPIRLYLPGEALPETASQGQG